MYLIGMRDVILLSWRTSYSKSAKLGRLFAMFSIRAFTSDTLNSTVEALFVMVFSKGGGYVIPTFDIIIIIYNRYIYVHISIIM